MKTLKLSNGKRPKIQTWRKAMKKVIGATEAYNKALNETLACYTELAEARIAHDKLIGKKPDEWPNPSQKGDGYWRLRFH